MNWLLLLPGVLAAELRVGAGGDYPTIGEALALAAPGDTLAVLPGTYRERLTVDVPVTITAVEGLGTVILDGAGAESPLVLMYTGTLHGFTLLDASGVGVSLVGGARIEGISILNPGTTGVSVWGGLPTVREVLVQAAGTTAFQVLAGTPTLERSIAEDAGDVGFSLAAPGTYSNLVAFGGRLGFFLQAEATLSHVAVFEAREAGILASSTAVVSQAVLVDNPVALACQSNAVEMSLSLLWGGSSSQDCPAGPLHDNLLAAPQLLAWRAGARTPLVDLRPQEGSPLVDAGDGTDTQDGSQADVGPMGGEQAAWTDGDGDGVALFFDCDDTHAEVNLHAEEQANGLDDDCDGLVDEGLGTGDTGQGGDTGSVGEGQDIDMDGWSDTAGDCEDHNQATWPGAPERVDGADNDCDGLVDEGTWVTDDDGDGFSEIGGDCDDGDAARHPGAAEQGDDGVDDDCDGRADGDGAADLDLDGWTVAAGDCDDTRAAVHPGADDGLDGVDSDCDGVTDDDGLAADLDHDGLTVGDRDCDDGDLSVSPTSPERADDGIDQDCDGVDLYDVDGDGEASPAAGGEDCDDLRAEAYPGAPELCNGMDDDCDGRVDEVCSAEGLDGPHQDPWRSAIHDGCNCHSGGRADPGSWALCGLAGLCALAAARHRPQRRR